MKRLESVEEIPRGTKRSVRGRNQSSCFTMTTQFSAPFQPMQPPSEFNLQLNKIREREDEVKRAIETSEMILS